MCVCVCVCVLTHATDGVAAFKFSAHHGRDHVPGHLLFPP